MDQAVDYYRNRFRELDQNGDKFLEASELDAAIPIMDATSGKELVLKLDRNSDGKLSEDEFGVIANWLFQLAKSPAQLRFSDVECDEVPEVRSGNGLEENDPSSGRDMRTSSAARAWNVSTSTTGLRFGRCFTTRGRRTRGAGERLSWRRKKPHSNSHSVAKD